VKKIYQAISEFFVIRWLTLLGIKVFFVGGRLLSHLRFKALVPNSGQSVCHWSVEIKYGNNIEIGDHTSIAQYACIGAKSKITIGDYVRISRGVVIETAGLDLSQPPPYKHNSSPITIADGVWIASDAIILPGVTIGENAIIGAGAVISKDVAPYSVVVGQPVRTFDDKINRKI